MSATEVKTTTCYMCACRCGIRVHLEDGKLRYIDGNPDHPLNQGVICAKGAGEVTATIEAGERFEAKFGRIGFRRNFAFDGEWNGKRCGAKQVEAYAVEEDGWLVITVIVKFF